MRVLAAALCLALASPAAAASLGDVQSAADALSSQLLRAIPEASTGKARVYVAPIAAPAPASPAAVALADAIVLRLSAAGAVMLSARSANPDVVVSGEIIELAGAWVATLRVEDVGASRWKAVVQSPLGAKAGAASESSAAASGKPPARWPSQAHGSHWLDTSVVALPGATGLQLGYRYRAKGGRWQAAVEGTPGTFRFGDSLLLTEPVQGLGRPASPRHSDLDVRYVRLRGDYVISKHLVGDTGNLIVDTLFNPTTISLGGGLGWYATHEDDSESFRPDPNTNVNILVHETSDHADVRPSFHAALSWVAFSVLELKFQGDYVVLLPRYGAKNRQFGGLGAEGTIGVRFW